MGKRIALLLCVATLMFGAFGCTEDEILAKCTITDQPDAHYDFACSFDGGDGTEEESEYEDAVETTLSAWCQSHGLSDAVFTTDPYVSREGGYASGTFACTNGELQ